MITRNLENKPSNGSQDGPYWTCVGPALDPCWILINLRISQRRFLLVDDLDVEVDETEHSEADEADLHRNKLK